MKVVALLGSPRPAANSAVIANHFLRQAETLGATTRVFELGRLNYRGCQGCYACKGKADHCVLDDDLTEVLEAVRDADLVVMASPVYYGDVTSQLKGFIDRTFAYFLPDYATNPNPSRLTPKKLLFVLTQGHPNESLFDDIYARYQRPFKRLGFAESRLIRVCGIGPHRSNGIPEHTMEQTAAAARELVAAAK